MTLFHTMGIGDLNRHFRSLDLDKLRKINHSYGAHFESLEKSIDQCEEQLRNYTRILQQLQLEKTALENTCEQVSQEEEKYQLERREVLSNTGGRTERFLVMQSLNYSPMASYNTKLQTFLERISQQNFRIKNGNHTLIRLNGQKSRAVEELRLLNSIIKEKALEAEASRPTYSLNNT